MNSTPSVDSELESLFRSGNAAHDAFLSRLFGLFSEDVVRFWCRNERAAYRDLGRPTLWKDGQFATLDFTLESRADGLRYAAELKAEMAFEGYRYLRLIDAGQLAHHSTKRAFAWLLDLAAKRSSFKVRVAARPVAIAGAILVWGASSPQGRAHVISEHGFADVLSLESMLDDLHEWADVAWQQRVSELRAWSDGMWDVLGGAVRIEDALP
jgi:hypothetical protein